MSVSLIHSFPFALKSQWRSCALRHGIQNSMAAILTCQPALSTEWLDPMAKGCELPLWHMRTSPIQWKPFWLATQLYPQNDWLSGNFASIMTYARRPHGRVYWFVQSNHFVKLIKTDLIFRCVLCHCVFHIHSLKGSVDRSRHERHFCSLLPYFLLSWLQIFQLCLSFWTSSFHLVLF